MLVELGERERQPNGMYNTVCTVWALRQTDESIGQSIAYLYTKIRQVPSPYYRMTESFVMRKLAKMFYLQQNEIGFKTNQDWAVRW